ncbi:MAG: hypothetical protein ABI896_08410 [Actinomycetota bacterium]
MAWKKRRLALLPSNITTNPRAFWPFVLADFGFGGLSALFLALHMWGWASVVLWLGVPPNLYFAFPAFFFPAYAIKKTSFSTFRETVWLRNAGLLIFIITAGHVLAAIDPERFQAVAWLTVGGRMTAGVYWVIVALSKPVPAESSA